MVVWTRRRSQWIALERIETLLGASKRRVGAVMACAAADMCDAGLTEFKRPACEAISTAQLGAYSTGNWRCSAAGWGSG